MDSTFLQARIDAISAQITAYEDALTALASDNVRSYTLNTGQTVQTVTKRDVVRLSNMLDWLYTRYDLFYSRLNGGTSIYVRGSI